MSDTIVSIGSLHCEGHDENAFPLSHGDHCTNDTSVDESYA